MSQAIKDAPEPCKGGHAPVAKWDGHQWIYADYCRWCGVNIPRQR